MTLPMIIQGGMGAGVSNWRLANAVASRGHLGVVSGTAMATILARRLQDGDAGGHMRRALAHFPDQGMASRILDRYYIEGGKAPGLSYRPVPMYTLCPGKHLQELTVVANFAEVFLAKEGHAGVVGINLLEKIQLPNLLSLFGAVLAGVDYVLMGAGIPREIPGVLDALAEGRVATLKIDVRGTDTQDDFRVHLDPHAFLGDCLPSLTRPRFLAIISSVTLAIALVKKGTGRIDGFVIEGPTAGGHNAPPRGAIQLNQRGEPIYGARDEVDLNKIRELGLPFWLAGSFANPGKLQQVLDCGATGIQVGTVFALCEESGLAPEIKRTLVRQAITTTVDVFTDPDASPTGFPFKVARLAGTISESDVYGARPRMCDLGYLRTAYKKTDGTIGMRCPSQPIDTYLKQGGTLAETVGRKCVCNGLMANIGLGQMQKNGYIEKPLVTTGDDLTSIASLLSPGEDTYTVADVLRYLCSPPDSTAMSRNLAGTL